MNVKTQQQIRERLAKIKADERLHYPTATVFENAPLALIQMDLEAERDALWWVLAEAEPKG